MFDTSPTPRVFGLPPGADFARQLVAGLRARSSDLSRTTVFVNTSRMQRRLREVFDSGLPCLLPRIRLVTDLGIEAQLDGIPAATPPLRRRLELSQAVAALLASEPELAPPSALFALSDSLANLMEEMHGEGVHPDTLATLDVTDQSGHWQRALQFLNILRPYFETADALPDPQARLRRVAEMLAARWVTAPPQGPVIIAGSTGSRGATAVLMQAVARLPQGALVLPGFDFDAPNAVWDRLIDPASTKDDPITAEDHPQYRFRALLGDLGLPASAVQHWHPTDNIDHARNRLVSLALRPAPITQAWRIEGPALGDLPTATQHMSLVEADSPRIEAETIALCLRQAIDAGQTAALITPDRMLTRQVAAALDRWDITPDDSAGTPLALTAAGRMLRHVADLLGQTMTAENLLSLLKHPLTHSGADRGPHLLRTRRLELHIRRYGPPFPTGADLIAWADRQTGQDPDAPRWAAWLAPLLADFTDDADAPIADHLTRHLSITGRLCAGPDTDGTGDLWGEKPGREALRLCETLAAEADAGGTISPRDYASLFGGIINTGSVRDRDAGHPQVLIWGTLEARVGGADLVIMGSMNDGTWPEAATPDPWLNRQMRRQAGLLLPERRIGLSAHDFQQAVAAPRVIITRAKRSADAETVPSRWVNRLLNLLGGLPDTHGPDAIAAMRARGQIHLDQAIALSRPTTTIAKAQRPSPRPPLAARPVQLSVTQIKTLIRDPYAIYASKVLRLKSLDPLQATADAPLRGTLFHTILERFIDARPDASDPAALALFLDIARDVLATDCPWPTIRLDWLTRLEQLAPGLLASEAQRQTRGDVLALEAWGEITVAPTPVKLTCKADRIDTTDTGDALIYDYKTGTMPTAPQQKSFDKQLLLTSAMVQRGAFDVIGPRHVADAAFLGISKDLKTVAAPLADNPPDEVWENFVTLLQKWAEPDRGYTARMAMFSGQAFSPYDHLSRLGEWDTTDTPAPVDLT